MPILADTDVLLRLAYEDEVLHPAVVASVAHLGSHGYKVFVAPQSLREFWNVSTRPADRNGFGRTVPETDQASAFLERHFEILHETTEMHTTWRRLLVEHEVKGV